MNLLKKVAHKLGYRRSKSSVILESSALLLGNLYRDHLLSQPRYADPLRLNRFGHRMYSQGEEDGYIHEIFRRIGIKHRTFVEIGVENGLENNTLALLLQGWRGLWIEGGTKHVQSIKQSFQAALGRDQLRAVNAFITRENINELLQKNAHGMDFDLFGIDITGNDYHVLEAIKNLRACVVVVEYNAKFPPGVEWIMPYEATYTWNGTEIFGASLTAYENLLRDKGYSLVGCSLTGTNAFFVRSDLLDTHFSGPFTAEHHFEPARYWLLPTYRSGHRFALPKI
jgi:hypothetical protein